MRHWTIINIICEFTSTSQLQTKNPQDKYFLKHITPPQTHTHKHLVSSCHTLRVSDPYWAIKFIFVLQIDSLIYCVLLCGCLNPDLGCEKRRKHSIITFYGFIQLPQWCCHTEMAPLCYSAQRSSYFMLTVYHNNEEDDRFSIIQMWFLTLC